MNHFLVSTTDILQDKTITEYVGVVNAQTVYGVNVVKDIFASVRDFFGGRSGALEETIQDAMDQTMAELIERAKAKGADGIIGVQMQTQISNMISVSAVGTMVKF